MIDTSSRATLESQPFARLLTAWVDPLAILECASIYETSPEVALTVDAMEIAIPAPAAEAQSALLALAKVFLDCFRLSPGQLAAVRLFSTRSWRPSTWPWLESLQFEGRLTEPAPAEDEVAAPRLALRIEERVAVLHLLRSPIAFLVGTAQYVSETTWSAGKKIGVESVALEHSSPGPLGVYLDGMIGGAFYPGLLDGAVTPASAEVRLRVRAVTIAGPLPLRPSDVEAGFAAERLRK
jgi:hypothetical protein